MLNTWKKDKLINDDVASSPIVSSNIFNRKAKYMDEQVKSLRRVNRTRKERNIGHEFITS